ncbi:hypothetical protein BH11BAC2_BH11BAC2_11870 [soil metagenome]
MKKTLLICLTLLAFTTLRAQTSGGPDAYGYVWRDSNDPNGPVYNWIDIITNPDAIRVLDLADDNTSGPKLLPGAFQFYWYTVDRFWIGSNGYIAFAPGNFASPFPSIPSTAAPNNVLAAQMSDLNLDTTTTAAGNPGQVWYWTSALGDSLVVTWIDVPYWQQGTPSFGGQNTFQIILNYNDSSITYQYNTQVGSSAAVADYMAIGIENNSGSVGLEHSHDVYPPTSYAIRFYPPASTTLQINDASTTWNDNPDNAAKILSKNGNPFNLKTNIANTGNTALTTFNVLSVVRTTTNATLVTNTTASNALNAGQTQLINQPNALVPSTSGTLRFITTTQLPGDATPSNDSRTVEVQVVDTTTLSIELSYDNGLEAGLGGISWSGGDGGCANSYVPPFYPCNITSVSEWIVDDPNGVGYYMKVFADNGPNKSPGTLLDSIFVAPGSFTIGGFVNTPLTAPLRIDSGGFYVTWYMAGDGVALGQNNVTATNPVSNRTFEVLGGTYAEYRSREVQDHMIRVQIQIVGVGVNEINANDGFSSFYPNPASETSSIEFDAAKLKGNDLFVSVYNLEGKMISTQKMNSGNGKIDLNVKGLNAGVYLVKINAGTTEVKRKLNVIK